MQTGTDHDQRNLTLLDCSNMMVPVLVFHKKYAVRPQYIKPKIGLLTMVCQHHQAQIGRRRVETGAVGRGRIETKDDPILGVLDSPSLHQGLGLFPFSNGCSVEPNSSGCWVGLRLSKALQTMTGFLATQNQGQGFGVPHPGSDSNQAPVGFQSQIVGPSQIGNLLVVAIHNTALECSLFKVQIRLFAAFVDRQDPAYFKSPQ